jgi:serine/threonine-protein phosphatase 2A activator
MMCRSDFQAMPIMSSSASLPYSIQTDADLVAWKTSPGHQLLEKVVGLLTTAVRGRPRVSSASSPIVIAILETFGELHKLLKEAPAVAQPAPFSNPGFKTWHRLVTENSPRLLAQITSDPEPVFYFLLSFGNPTRLDFGSGHELNFLAFIACLFKLNLLHNADAASVVFDVFWGYWDCFQAVQSQYRLEPAGTHGAWGLDDYVALPFVFGSSQLVGHPELSPQNVVERELGQKYEDVNAYSRWISYLYRTKSGSFQEHSRVLAGLTSVASFEQLNAGMVAMYKGEVLEKLPVLQRFGVGKHVALRSDEPA